MTVLLSIPEMCATKSRMALEKPKMNSAELVDKMIEKGIIIEPYTKKYVEDYLLKSNNFLRLCSYRKLYDKYPCGKTKENISVSTSINSEQQPYLI